MLLTYYSSGSNHHCGNLCVLRVHSCDYLGVLFAEDDCVPGLGNQWLHYLDYSRYVPPCNLDCRPFLSGASGVIFVNFVPLLARLFWSRTIFSALFFIKS